MCMEDYDFQICVRSMQCTLRNIHSHPHSFYRYVLEPELSFTLDGAAVTPMAVFSDLPQTSLLTLHLDVPHSWLVEAVWSPHDLDNIHLDGVVGGGVQADFQLKNILVEGE